MLAALALAAAASPAQPGLAVFAPFLDRCWAGEVGPGAIDTHCFTSVYGGQHVRDDHRVEVAGRTVYAGQTLYSVEGAVIAFTYWNSMGGIGRGTATRTNPRLSFTGSMRANPAAKPQPLVTNWRWLAPDRFEVRNGKTAVLFRQTTPSQPKK